MTKEEIEKEAAARIFGEYLAMLVNQYGVERARELAIEAMIAAGINPTGFELYEPEPS